MKPPFKTRAEFTEWVADNRRANEEAHAERQAEADKNMIKIEDLVIGTRYAGEGRNFNEAVWDGEAFIGMRTKFGQTYEFPEDHWDADDHYGTFRPEKICDEQ